MLCASNKQVCNPTKRAFDGIKDWVEQSKNDIKTLFNHVETLHNILDIFDGDFKIGEKIKTVCELFIFNSNGTIKEAHINIPTSTQTDPIKKLLVIYNKDTHMIEKGVSFGWGMNNKFLNGAGEFVKPGEYLSIKTDILWEDLLNLKQRGKLLPGMWYNITDYGTYILHENAYSDNEQINILMLATSETTLNENVYFVAKPNTQYSNRNVSVWKGKYCLDNNEAKFNWLNTVGNFIMMNDLYFIKNTTYNTVSDSDTFHAWIKLNTTPIEIKKALQSLGSEFNITLYYDESVTIFYTLEENPTINSPLYINTNRIIEGYISQTFPKSKGTIYLLCDEYNNIIPFDYINITFEVDNKKYKVFDLNAFNSTNTIYNNHIEPLYLDNGSQDLNSIILKTSWCNNNYFGETVTNVILESKYISYNIFKGSSNDINLKVSNKIISNVFGINCLNIKTSLCTDFSNNTIGNNFTDNNILSKITNCNIGNNVTGSLIFGDNCELKGDNHYIKMRGASIVNSIIDKKVSNIDMYCPNTVNAYIHSSVIGESHMNLLPINMESGVKYYKEMPTVKLV